MTFRSILFQKVPASVSGEQPAAPDFFADLNLNQIVSAITVGKEEYNLKPFFYLSLRDADTIGWRQEIMRDLENTVLCNNIKAFSNSMRAMREHLAQAEKLSYELQKERWFFDAAEIYCDAVMRLVHDLSNTEIASRGLSDFRAYVTRYIESNEFASLLAQTKKLSGDLASVHYNVFIDGSRVDVRRYGGERDYSADVEATFTQFEQGAAKNHAFKFANAPEMNHVEARILDLVAQLYPETFLSLKDYCVRNKRFQDDLLATFDREIQFYVAYLAHIDRLKKVGLNFCYPRIVQSSKEVYNYEGFDLALADKLIGEGPGIVCNDFYLKSRERITVVSGPNQGGKTTFARTFGQLHYLASLGCPVPGTQAQLYLFDNIFTHFEKEESINNLQGKLQDDLVRAHHILESATPYSIIILNEIFTSTTLQDAIVLSKKIAAKIMALDALCVWVTFIEELSTLSEQTVSMVSTVVPENPAQRTYKIIRQPADGAAYAMSLAEKYRLSHAMIKERIKS